MGAEPDFQMVDSNGIRLRVALSGAGPLVVLVHGFPESWYSWRHQITPIAKAGFKACAIDVRGYNGSTKFPNVSDYSMEPIVADVRGVAEKLAPGKPAVLLGHDWGAPIVYNTALIHPEKFTAVGALSVVYTGVPVRSFDELIKENYDDKNLFFYQSYFREPGKAEAVFDANPRDFLRRFYFIGSGDVKLEEVVPAMMTKTASSTLLEGMPDPKPFPAWLSDADLDYFVHEFEQSGFFGPLSRYRNHTRDFQYLQQFKDRKIEQPAFFIAGKKDGAYNGFGALADPIGLMRQFVPNLEGGHELEGCGHWTQQERPKEVNDLLIPWLSSLKGRVV
jgi:pimeloyl-ACP methyl ester carboxylesterase